LFKIKSKIPDFERGRVKKTSGGMYLIFRALFFERNADVGQKDHFRMDTIGNVIKKVTW